MRPAVLESARKLLTSALLFTAVLLFFGAFRWGSAALIIFSGLWFFQLLREIAALRQVTPPVSRE